jgi:RHS repeat-associated protein
MITVPAVGTNTGFIATQNYSYDSLNRLKDATENITPTGGSSTQSWKQTFTFDRYGNRNFDEANTTTIPRNCAGSTICVADRKAINPTISTSTNRLVQDQDNDSVNDYVFDSAGNTTRDASGKTFIYDGENKQTEVKDASSNTVGQYSYDGDGKRVKKIVSATGETTIFVYDAAGKSIAEYSTIVSTTPQVSYLTSDNLGSPRINTDQNGAVTARHDYLPYGEEIAMPQRNAGLGYATDDVRKKFADYERDQETILEYAGSRYYSSSRARFTTIDPLMSSGKPTRPDTWNRYLYVLNNPLILMDPVGLYVCTAGSANCDKFDSALDRARTTGLASIKSRYGEKSDKYTNAKAAVDSYGKKGEKNGVTIMVGNLAHGGGAATQVAGVKSKSTTENPTGQNIHVVVTQSAFNNDLDLNSTVVHEGSHVADAAEWVKCDFCANKNPTTYDSEMKAYLVEATYAQANNTNERYWYQPVQTEGKLEERG